MNVSLTDMAQLKARLGAMPDPTVKYFSLEWDESRMTDCAYELAFDWRKMVEDGKVDGPSFGPTWRPHTAYALEAVVDGRWRRLSVDALPGRDWRELVLRFRVPDGTSGLRLLGDVSEQFEVRDTVTCDNLFAGLIEPRHPFGVKDRRFTLEVPASAKGKGVKLEWRVRNQSGKDAIDVLRAVALRHDRCEIGDLFPAGELKKPLPREKTTTFFAEGRIPSEADKIVLEVVGEGEFLTTRLVARVAESLTADF